MRLIFTDAKSVHPSIISHPWFWGYEEMYSYEIPYGAKFNTPKQLADWKYFPLVFLQAVVYERLW
jgi:hypothetical protein